MCKINDVADYVIIRIKTDDKNASLINLKLQKLLYYIQAWSYGIDGKPMFDGAFQAWVHGPVSPTIYRRFQDTKSLYSEIELSDVINKDVKFSEEKMDLINYILENYTKFSGSELEKLTHMEDPWITARGGIGLNERCTKVISIDSMKKYYGKKWAELNAE